MKIAGFPSASGSWILRSHHAHAQLLHPCLTLYNPMAYRPPGSSIHGISQKRILEWAAISFSRASSWPRDQTRISCTAGRFFISEPRGKPKHHIVICKIRSTLSSIKLDFKLFFNHWNYLVLRRVRVGDLPGDFSLLDTIAQLCPTLCDFMDYI